MTPRSFPRENAIRNIMKPAYDGYLPVPMEAEYSPPDVFNPALYAIEDGGGVDYLGIVENGIDFREIVTFDNSPLPAGMVNAGKVMKLGIDSIKPGLGWFVDGNANPDECDGSYDGFCNRGIDQNCLLYGHNDHRGGVGFDSRSGWGVFVVPNVKIGIIMLRMEWWHRGKENARTLDWTEENNGDPNYARRLLATNATKAQPSRRMGQSAPSYQYSNHTARQLGGGPELCANLKFEFAVNGKITSYTKDEYMEHLQVIERVVQCQTVLNDTSLIPPGEAFDVELAVRLSGCEQQNLFYISHIYWA